MGYFGTLYTDLYTGCEKVLYKDNHNFSILCNYWY